MKPKFKLHEIVKIKNTGEKTCIDLIDRRFPVTYLLKTGQWVYESELKPYRPSRAGVRGKDGRFISKKQFAKESEFPPGFNCPVCFKRFSYLEEMDKHARIHQPTPTPKKIEKPYTHEKNSSKENIIFSKIIELIDANSALEERVRKLEKRV